MVQIVVACLLVLIVLRCLARFSKKCKIKLDIWSGRIEAKGENEPSGIKIKRAKAGRDITTLGAGASIDLEDVEAQRDIRTLQSNLDDKNH